MWDAGAKARVGLVDSYDPTNHSAKVRFQPEDVLSGWLPIGSPSAGSGGGAAFAPSIGDQVVVHPLEGAKQAGVIGERLYSNADRPPAAPAGEFWFINPKSGSLLKIANDGSITLTSNQGQTLTVGADWTVNVTGSVNLTAAHVNITSSDINLGASGGAAVARVGDTVSGGVITSGSAKVKCA